MKSLSVTNLLIIKFLSVGKVRYSVSIQESQNNSLPLIGFKEETTCFQVKITINGEDNGTGIVILSRPSKEPPVILPTPQYKRVTYSPELPVRDKLIYFFFEDWTSSVSISGGKGASLALLTEISGMENIIRGYAGKPQDDSLKVPCPKFTVPKGLVISVFAMDMAVSKNMEFIRDLKNLESNCALGIEFAANCAAIQEKFLAVEMPEDIRFSLKFDLEMLTKEKDARFAVRSSSVCEDGEDVSAAGQNETFLGLRSVEEIYDAIKKCWASLYSFQSVQYRIQNIQPVLTRMAVAGHVGCRLRGCPVLSESHIDGLERSPYFRQLRSRGVCRFRRGGSGQLYGPEEPPR